MSGGATARETVPAEPGRAARRAVTGFVVRFVLGWAVVLAAVAWIPGLEERAVNHTVWSLGLAARACRMPYESAGAVVDLNRVGMQIVPDCTPLMPFAAFAIAVLAFPAPWLWRLGGLAAGAALLWLYNIVRIFALVPVLRYRPEWFEFIHVYLWQTTTLLVVFAMFMAWLGAQRGGSRAGVEGPAGGGRAEPGPPP